MNDLTLQICLSVKVIDQTEASELLRKVKEVFSKRDAVKINASITQNLTNTFSMKGN